MHFNILMKMNLNLMKLQPFGKKSYFYYAHQRLFKTLLISDRISARSFPARLTKISATATMYSCSLGWSCAAWLLALCDVRTSSMGGLSRAPMSLNNGEMEANGFECKTWISSYGTWHQSL